MAHEFIARKGLIVSGSTQLTGSLNVSRGITGSLFGTSSWAVSASWAPSAVGSTFPFNGNAVITGSLLISGSGNSLQVSGSASIRDNFTVNGATLFVNAANNRVGVNTLTPNTTLSVNGNANITGSLDVTAAFTAQTKSFKIQHQRKSGKSLIYGVLEGPEHGVFCRGKLIDTDTILLPDEWEWLVDVDSITVQLTPIGKHQKLYVDEVTSTHIIIGNDNIFNSDIECYYTVFATRKDVEPLQTIG